MNEFVENMSSLKGSKVITAHHEQTKLFKDKFCQHIDSLMSEMKILENPFLDNDENLICLVERTKLIELFVTELTTLN